MSLLLVAVAVFSSARSALGYNFTATSVPSQSPHQEVSRSMWGIGGTNNMNASDLIDELGKGECAACIERHNDYAAAIKMNFKDIHGDSNWNTERFSAGHHTDCTTEIISGSDPIKMVQFFPRGANCICRIVLACHESITGYQNAMVTLAAEALIPKWQSVWPKGKQVKNECPDGCIMLTVGDNGLKGMNVLGSAFKCTGKGPKCVHDSIEMW